jgi:hypothetical protein
VTVRLAAALVMAVALAAPAVADEAHIRVGAAFAATVQTGERSGLTVGLEVDPRGPLVTVSQILRPLTAAPSYPLGAPEACGDPDALAVAPSFVPPRELAAAAASTRSALDVLVATVAFVSRRVTLDETDNGLQDGEAVLRRGRGRCSGRANLAVGLLRSLGIPARVVHGVVFEGNTARWHRWGEAWLGPLGWLPLDPGTGAGVVSVRYLPCRAIVPGLQPQGLILERVDDQGFRRLPRRSGLAVPFRRGVNLRCVAPAGTSDVTAILVAADGMRWARRGGSEVAFAGLEPGRYWLSWHTAEATVSRMRLDLVRQGDVSLVLDAGSAVLPPGGRAVSTLPATGRAVS